MNIEKLKAELKSHLAAAAKIAKTASDENRGFTPEERRTAQEHLGAAQLLKQRIADADPDGAKAKQAAGDEEMRKQIAEFDAGFDFGATGGTRKSARPAGAWSKAFFAKMGHKDFFTPSGTVGAPSLAQYLPAVGEKLETVLQVLTPIQTGESAIKFLQEVERQHNAAPVATGAKKPTSTYEIVEVVAPLETVAHLSTPINRAHLADAPNLERYLDTVLRQGLILALENQLVNGSGETPELYGLLTANGRVVLPPTPGDDLLAIARRAITVLELQSLSTDDMVFLIHPTVWEAFELTESTPSGEYKLDPGRQPINRARRTLWSVPVALSVAVPTDVIILFHKQAVNVYERETVRIDWSEGLATVDEQPHNLFEHNQVVFRAEGRWAQCIYKPDAIVEVQLDTGS